MLISRYIRIIFSVLFVTRTSEASSANFRRLPAHIIMEMSVLSSDAKLGHASDDRGSSNGDQFVQSFPDWIVRFGERKEDLLANTFVDEHGIRRYADTWMICKELSQRDHQAITGCVDLVIPFNREDAGPLGNKSTGKKWESSLVVSFLTNFRTLWAHFEHQPSDELAHYAPLFKLYISLFCHRRTSQLMIVLTAYYLSVLIIVDVVYPISPPLTQFINYFSIILQTGTYLALVVLFRGSMFPTERVEHGDPITDNTTTEGEVKEHARAAAPRAIQSLHWFHYLKESTRNSIAELKRLVYQQYQQRASQKSSETPILTAEQDVPFYAALNIALKFMSKHRRTSPSKLRLSCPKHNFRLLFIFFAVPLYMILTTYASPLGPLMIFLEVCRENGKNDIFCRNLGSVFAWTAGYTLPLLMKIIFMASVLLALVALSFGAEVGRAMVDLWINRFGCLRTLDGNGDGTNGGGVGKRGSGGSDGIQGDSKKGKDTRGVEPVISAIHAPSPGNGPSADTRSAAAAPSSASAATLATAAGGLGTPDATAVSEALVLVQRDAYESYLILREFMSCASRAWSFAIFTFVFLATFFVILFLFGGLSHLQTVSKVKWAYYTMWVAVRIALLAVYPITALAHANAYVFALQEQFLVAAPEDFALIGGRDAWLAYLDKVPAVWTVYGLAVSWDRLSGLLWAGVAGLGAIVLSSLFNTSS